MTRSCVPACLAVFLLFLSAPATYGVPYASRISINTAPSLAQFVSVVAPAAPEVSFVLNEPADQLGYRINGGPLQWLDGSTSGLKSFPLTSPLDTFDIVAKKTEATGYTVPTGGIVFQPINGLSTPVPEAGFKLISDDANVLTHFNSPRGVAVNTDPDSPAFGVAYVVNSAAGNTIVGSRTLMDGVYAINADGSDAFGYGDLASTPNGVFLQSSANSGFRVDVGDDGEVYVSDYSDAFGGVVRLSPDLSVGNDLLAFRGGPPGGLLPGSSHGSVVALHVEGSPHDGNLVLYTIDEDLTSNHLGGVETNDTNSLWKYDLGPEIESSLVQPTKVNDANVLLPLVLADLDRGSDGKFYLSQTRTAGFEASIFVLDANGSLLYSSLTASRELIGDPLAVDILRNVVGVAISPDQKWLAVLIRNNDIGVMPVENGIPDLSKLMVVDTGSDVVLSRDLAFDAVGNLHYVSSGTQQYRVISPGGTTYATTSWNGTSFSVNVSGVPEPASLALAGVGIAAVSMMRRRRSAAS